MPKRAEDPINTGKTYLAGLKRLKPDDTIKSLREALRLRMMLQNEQSVIIREWQRFAEKLAKKLDCLANTDDILLAVGELKKKKPPVKKIKCLRCADNKKVLSVPRNNNLPIVMVDCPDCTKGKRVK